MSRINDAFRFITGDLWENKHLTVLSACNESDCRPPGPFIPPKMFRRCEVIINENEQVTVTPKPTENE